jgi:hypothetical protein
MFYCAHTNLTTGSGQSTSHSCAANAYCPSEVAHLPIDSVKISRAELASPRSDVVAVISRVVIRPGVTRLTLAEVVRIGERDSTIVTVLVAVLVALIGQYRNRSAGRAFELTGRTGRHRRYWYSRMRLHCGIWY